MADWKGILGGYWQRFQKTSVRIKGIVVGGVVIILLLLVSCRGPSLEDFNAVKTYPEDYDGTGVAYTICHVTCYACGWKGLDDEVIHDLAIPPPEDPFSCPKCGSVNISSGTYEEIVDHELGARRYAEISVDAAIDILGRGYTTWDGEFRVASQVWYYWKKGPVLLDTYVEDDVRIVSEKYWGRSAKLKLLSLQR